MRWYRRFFRRELTEKQLDAELCFHLDQKVADLVATGITPEEARRRAQLEFGGLDQVKEECRDVGGAHIIESLIQDLRYGVRMLAKSPGFTVVAVLTLAVGVGVNTTLFTAIDTVALRPAPGRQSERLVRLTRQLKAGYGGSLFSYPEYTYYRDANKVFSGLIARSCCFDVVASGLPGSGGSPDSAASAERVSASLVSENFFSVLGFGAVVGRTFLPEEGETQGSHPVVVLGHSFWRTHFASDPNVIGRTILLNNTAFTIIGITLPDFVGTADPPVVSNIWVPLSMQEAIVPGSDWLHEISEYQLKMVGRLKPGISAHQARAELTVLATQLARSHPEKNHTASTIGINAHPATFMDFSSTGPQFLALVALLTAAVAMVLLIACANVANLLLARATTRHIILLTSGGLLVRGLIRGESVDPGFETKRVALFELELQNLHRGEKAPFSVLYHQILDRLGSVRGVESVALASHIPLLSDASTSIALQQTQASSADLPAKSFYNVISPGYFRTLSIPILRGRCFSDHGSEGLSVIVSASTGRRLWPGEDPLGKRIKTGRSEALMEVVGVAGDTRSVRLSEPDPVLLYFPLSPKEMDDPEKVLLIRTEDTPSRVLPALLSAMERIDQRLPSASSGFHTLDDAVWFQKLPSRLGASIAAALGCLALVLSTMGIYGLISYVVSQRTREIGIRVALGANRREVLKLILRQGTKLVAIGAVVGLAGSAVVAHVLALALAGDVRSPDLLFGLRAYDPVAFGGVSLMISGIALVACYVPARRAMKLDPMVALRHE